jgi:glycosyltransferase involved in cell wall biosynthesis
MNNPKVTVLMPVYNAEVYLRKSIESILNQTFTNLEFIIFNDGSTDGSAAIVSSYDDPRIYFINNQVNLGYARCLNTGLSIAKGEYIARMDADDVSLPNRLASQVSILDAMPHIGVCSTNVVSINENSETISEPWWKKTLTPIEWLLLWENPIAHPSVMIRKSVLEENEINYNIDCTPAEDYDLWCRLVLITGFYRIVEVFLHYRILTGSAFHSNRLKAYNHCIHSSTYLAQVLTSNEVPKVHSYLTVYPAAIGEEQIYFNYKEAKIWVNFLLKSASIYWKWNDDFYKHASKDAQKRIASYLGKFPEEKKPKFYLKKILFYLRRIFSFVHIVGKKAI